MELEDSPSLPNAHQQIRLGDIQASAQKWTAAIEYYLRAIEYFKAIQNTLRDDSLISIIQPQIVQCEKTIHFCRLKDRSEQAIKAERHSKITRAHSIASMKPSTKVNRTMTRHNTLQLENTVLLGGRSGTDSLAVLMFPNNNKNNSEISTKNPSPMIAKKKNKNDSQKMEELQMGYEALKTHLKTAFDDIERLKHENNELRLQSEGNNSPQHVDFGLLSTSHDDERKEQDDHEESENELEATL